MDIVRLYAAHPREIYSLERHGAEVVGAIEGCSSFLVDFFAGAQNVDLDLGGLAIAAVKACLVEEVDVATGCGEEELVDAVAGDVWEVKESEGCVRS